MEEILSFHFRELYKSEQRRWVVVTKQYNGTKHGSDSSMWCIWNEMIKQ